MINNADMRLILIAYRDVLKSIPVIGNQKLNSSLKESKRYRRHTIEIAELKDMIPSRRYGTNIFRAMLLLRNSSRT